MTSSVPAVITLTLTGTWVHDPDDPSGTAHQYPYGPGGGTTLDLAPVLTLYAGRQYPVADFGEHQQDQCKLSLDLPFGNTWSDDLASLVDFHQLRKTVLVRDGRGRKFFGILSDFSDTPQRWGSTVSVVVTRVTYVEGE